MEYKDDTIAAIATASGKGSIAVIRVSGKKALEITDSIFQGKKPLNEKYSHTLSFGKIIDPGSQKEIDQVLVSVFKSPNSFTGEDMVEINSHGGNVFPHKILKILLHQGCRLAEKGEFSKRAFFNGKIDLTQAEAINDMIQISTFAGSELALANLNQSLSGKLKPLKERLFYLLGLLQASLDNPEEELPQLSQEDAAIIPNSLSALKSILSEGERSRKIASGFRVVLTGKTNAGKSSVMNYLAGEEKAIVSQIHGTTRDVIETELNLAGYPVLLIDTAGLRNEVENEIESYGIIKAREEIKKADLILYIIDSQTDKTKEDETIIKTLPPEKTILCYNKIDLAPNKNYPLSFSAKTGEGITNLIERISQKLNLKSGEDSYFYLNLRQNETLSRFKVKLNQIDQMLLEKESEELIAFELHNAMGILGEILGYSLNEELMNTIFSNFCLGK